MVRAVKSAAEVLAPSKLGLELGGLRRVLALKLVDVASDQTLEEFCKQVGLSEAAMREALDDPLMFEEVWDQSFKHLMIPRMPQIIMRWRDKCESGDVNALKLLMQYKGKSAPDQHNHLHIHKEVSNMEGDALDRRIQEIQHRLESLDRESQ